MAVRELTRRQFIQSSSCPVRQLNSPRIDSSRIGLSENRPQYPLCTRTFRLLPKWPITCMCRVDSSEHSLTHSRTRLWLWIIFFRMQHPAVMY